MSKSFTEFVDDWGELGFDVEELFPHVVLLLVFLKKNGNLAVCMQGNILTMKMPKLE